MNKTKLERLKLLFQWHLDRHKDDGPTPDYLKSEDRWFIKDEKLKNDE